MAWGIMKAIMKATQTRPPDNAVATVKNEASISERPFFFIVMAALAFIFIVSILQTPALREPLRLIVYTGLMLAYAALFWLPLYRHLDRSGILIYLLMVTTLALTLSWMVASAALAFGLIAPLIGIAFGMIPNRLVAAAVVVGLLGLSALAIGLSAGWTQLSAWPLMAVPLTVFIVIYVTLYGRQAEARERAQALAAELEAANVELAAYASQVEELTLVAERQRMARELHDTLAQGVAGLILQLEAANAHLENANTDRAQMIVQQAMGRARTTLAEARQAIDDLRLAEQPPDDLAQAIADKARRFSTVTGVPCRLELAIPDDLSPTTQEQVLGAASEALANVARHAQATEARVSIKSGQHELLVEICDDGQGFDADAAIPPGHYGLLGIRERAREAGGSAEIRSGSEGTSVRLRLPLVHDPVPNNTAEARA